MQSQHLQAVLQLYKDLCVCQQDYQHQARRVSLYYQQFETAQNELNQQFEHLTQLNQDLEASMRSLSQSYPQERS